MFAPDPAKILRQITRNESLVDDDGGDGGGDGGDGGDGDKKEDKDGYVVVSGDYDGDLKVFYCFAKPKQSSLPMGASALASASASASTSAHPTK